MINLEISTKCNGDNAFSDALMLALAISSYKTEVYKEWESYDTEEKNLYQHQTVKEMTAIARVGCELAIRLAEELKEQR